MSAERVALLEGLSATPKRVSSKYFYDERGSELFERITELPEYYPTRTERALLETWAPERLPLLRPVRLVELGAGSAEKTELLLDVLVRQARERGSPACYVPVDVSGDFLERTAERLRRRWPDLRVEPLVADITAPLPLEPAREGASLVAFLGSTIGNFHADQAARLLARVRATLGAEDHLLLGVDLKPGPGKTVAELEAAYDDAQGVTAAFNLNVLHVLNRRFDGDFDAARFAHLALYDEAHERVEMHLVAQEAHTVRIAGQDVRFEAGERLRTEISCKYDRAGVTALFARAGLDLVQWTTDAHGRFGLALAAPAD